jgi:DNA (cytosine-5)-methyltransferase 1
MERQDYETETLIAHPLRADGFDASEDGTGRGTPITFQPGNLSRRAGAEPSNDVFPTLGSQTLRDQAPHIAFSINAGGNERASGAFSEELSPTLNVGQRTGVQGGVHVRRLTPRECERLQGFPDDYTLIPGRTADGPRYKALGNSMAVPVMRWIGKRIRLMEEILMELKR